MLITTYYIRESFVTNMIALQNFLPTDAVVNDAPLLLDYSLDQAVGIAPIVIGLIVFVFGLIGLQDKSMRVGQAICSFIVGAVLVVGGAGFVVTSIVHAVNYEEAKLEMRKTNIDSLVSNLESVYDVEVVRDNSLLNISTTATPKIMVVQDETAYEALVRQDSDTYEPTLLMVASPDATIKEFRKN